MATMLDKKPVVREAKEWKRRGLFGMGYGGTHRNLVVSLEPGNIISFREKGLRRRYDIDIESVFNLAVRRTTLRDEEKKRKEKAAKRGGHG
jgi:hypothetical protein